jgi:hypothetical protein
VQVQAIGDGGDDKREQRREVMGIDAVLGSGREDGSGDGGLE